jgi:hypothetical protein
VPHPGGPKIAPLVDRLKEAPSPLAAYVKHLAKSIPNQVLVVWTSLGPLPRWVPGPTTRWAPGTTRLALHGT